MKILELAGLTVLIGLIGAGLAGITITVFLHRGATHLALRMSRPVYEVGRAMTYLTVFMRHWEWRRIHRKHHLYTDVWIDEIRHDPHSPIVIGEREGIDGFKRVAWHMAAIFHEEAKCPDIRDTTYDSDADRAFDRLDATIYNKPVIGAVVTGFIYAALFGIFAPGLVGLHRNIGWELLCVVFGVLCLGVHIPTVLRFGGAINSDCHKGKARIDDAGFAMNVRSLSILIFGEGEHLTHHMNPQFAHLSKRWDLGWVVIRALRSVGLVQVIAERPRAYATIDNR
jgi:stearoyl-CoA desaturase (Delta-9 desaturase)